MPVGATIAAATVASAFIGSSAAKDAASTEAGAARDATAVQQQMFQQTRSDLQPFMSIGTTAAPAYLKLLGLGGPAAAPAGSTAGAFQGTGLAPTGSVTAGDPDYAAYVDNNLDVLGAWNQPGIADWYGGDKAAYGRMHYESSGKNEGRAPIPLLTQSTPQPKNDIQSMLESLPGYQFTRDQGIQEVNRSLGSRGLTGAQAKGIARFVTGLADKTYGDQVARLQGATTIGANAAAGVGNIGQGYAGSIGNNIVGAGQATAAGQVGSANALSSGVSTLGNYALANKYLGGGGIYSPVQSMAGVN